MKDNRIFRLTPKRIYCPICDSWHDWEGKTLQSYDEQNPYIFECELKDSVELRLWVEDDCIHIESSVLCDRINTCICDTIYLDDINYDMEEPIIKFYASIFTDEIICSDECAYCDLCFLPECGDKRDDFDDEYELNLEFKIEFASKYFNRYVQAQKEAMRQQELEKQQEEKVIYHQKLEKQQAEKAIRQQELEKQYEEKDINSQIKEDRTMEKTTQVTKTTIWDQLYKHAPEENVEILKEWANKYKPTLKWAVPVLSIYAAYRILNSRNSNLTVENIDSECKKKLGFSLDLLKDKKALSELMAIGGLSAGAYAAIKAVSAIYKKDDETDVSVEEIEEGMDKLDGISKKFSFIQPKTEALLPIATSVIIVYVMTQKPKWFEVVKDKANKLGGNLSTKASVYLEMVKLFVADKLNIDLNNEEDAQKFKKFALLGAIVGVGALVYGKKIFGDKAVFEDGEVKGQRNEKLEAFVSQILSIMEDLMPTAFAGATTYLVTKHVLRAKEDVVDVEVNEETSPEEAEEKATPEAEETVPASTKEVDEK